jgi:adenylate cyclase
MAAAAHFARIHVLDPQFDLETYLATLHYKDEADLQHHREGLLKAGFGR